MLFEIALYLVANTAIAFAIGAASRHFKFMLLLLIYSLVLSIGGALSMSSSFPVGAGDLPYLAGSDGESYFEDAVNLAREGIGNFQDVITANYAGHQIYLAAWFGLFGASLMVATVANNLLLMLSILCLFKASLLLTRAPQAALLACVAMMLTTSHIYHALLLLKEPAICLAFSLMLLSVCEALNRRGLGLRALLMFLAGIAILIAMRGTLLLFVLVLLGYLATLFVRQRSHVLVMLAAVLLVMVPLAQTFTTYTLDAEFLAETVLLNTVISQTLEAGTVDAGGVVGQVSGAYLALPFAIKLILFIVPTSLQVLLPFDFWSTAFLDDHFSMFFSRNLNPLWFLFVAVWAGFALLNVHKLQDPLLARLLLAGATFYVVIAVIYGGAIPRYGAPALYFIYPAIGHWWLRYREELAVRKEVHAFFRVYCGGLLLLLLPYLALNLARGV